MARLRYNGLVASVGGTGTLTAAATSITFGAALTSSGGVAVPTITGSDYIPLTLLDSNGIPSEVVYLTAYTSAGTTGTIVRGREGFAATTHNVGDKVVCSPTRADVHGDPPPNAPSAYDDEFDGTSLVTWTSTPTAPTSWDINTTRPSHAVLRSNGNGGNWVGKYQPVPTTYPYTITARLSGQNSRGASQSVGLFIGPASPTSTSNIHVVHTQILASETPMQRSVISFAGTYVSGVRATSTAVVASGYLFRDPGLLYIRIKVNSATSVDSSLSRDGWNWSTFESGFNPGFTPGIMGLIVCESGTADLTAHFDYFRIS